MSLIFDVEDILDTGLFYSLNYRTMLWFPPWEVTTKFSENVNKWAMRAAVMTTIQRTLRF